MEGRSLMTKTNLFIRESFMHHGEEDQRISQNILVYGHPDVLFRLANKTVDGRPGQYKIGDRVAFLFDGKAVAYETNVNIDLLGWTPEHAYVTVEIRGRMFTCDTMIQHVCKCLNDYGLSYRVDDVGSLRKPQWVLLEII